MKRIITLFLIIGSVLGGSFLFAEDASTLPARTGRISLVGAFGFSTGEFDKEWEYKGSDKIGMMVLPVGAALEYGILNWLTAAVQWAPGINAWSKFENDDMMSAFGFYDIFAGAKILIIGEKAPVKNNNVRLALAVGAKIPLPGADFKKESENYSGGDKPYIPVNVDTHVFGIGARAYFDIVFNRNFFLDFYGSFAYYPIKGDLDKASLKGYIEAQAPGINKSGVVDYGYALDFEIEPRYVLPIDKIILGFGLPITFKMTPGVKTNFPVGVPGVDSEPTASLSMKPGVSLMLANARMPLEFKFEYGLPIIGKNVSAMHTAVFGIKAYIRI